MYRLKNSEMKKERQRKRERGCVKLGQTLGSNGVGKYQYTHTGQVNHKGNTLQPEHR